MEIPSAAPVNLTDEALSSLSAHANALMADLLEQAATVLTQDTTKKEAKE